jgi:hypothetical protein
MHASRVTTVLFAPQEQSWMDKSTGVTTPIEQSAERTRGYLRLMGRWIALKRIAILPDPAPQASVIFAHSASLAVLRFAAAAAGAATTASCLWRWGLLLRTAAVQAGQTLRQQWKAAGSG